VHDEQIEEIELLWNISELKYGFYLCPTSFLLEEGEAL
jgi:hypothetical protein